MTNADFLQIYWDAKLEEVHLSHEYLSQIYMKFNTVSRGLKGEAKFLCKNIQVNSPTQVFLNFPCGFVQLNKSCLIM